MTRHYNGAIHERLAVHGETTVNGVLAGGAVVTGVLHLGGVCSGPLRIQKDGVVFIVGVVSGSLSIAAGGEAHVGGVVSGPLTVDPDGRLVASVGAVIGGRVLSADGTLQDASGDPVWITDETPQFVRQPDGSWMSVDA